MTTKTTNNPSLLQTKTAGKSHTETTSVSVPTPMGNLLSIILFGGPAFLLFASFHWFRTALLDMGMNGFDALMVSMIAPLAVISVLPLIGYHMELRGKEFDLTHFRQRFRYDNFSWKYLFYGLLGYGLLNIGYGIFMQINIMMIDQGIFFVPRDVTPLFDPRIVFDMAAFELFVGSPLYHNWKVLIIYSILLFFNIVGEELWWRGYILPRQEAHYGRYTWIVHGIMWNLFHVFKWWDLVSLLPVTLGIAYVAQKKKENWTPFFMHLFFNGMFGFILLIHVLTG